METSHERAKYDDFELPEFSEEQEAVRKQPLGFKALIDHTASNYTPETVDLCRLRGSIAMREIDRLVSTYVIDQMKALNLSADFYEHLDNAIARADWSGVDADSAERFVLRELITRANIIKSELIYDWIMNADETGLTPVARLEYIYLADAMQAADRMFLKMVTETAKSPIDSTERKARGMTNECAVVREVGGQIVEVPYHEAFPEETEVMIEAYCNLYDHLDSLLREHHEDSRMAKLICRKQTYYLAVIEATRSSKKEDWVKADTLLAGQIVDGSDATHFHPIETGYMQDRTLRAPEIGLRIPDINQTEAQRRSAATKAMMIKHLSAGPLSESAVVTSIPLVENSNATVRHFLGSGGAMDLKPAGQILPNEYEARVNGGIDSSLDFQTAVERYPLQREAFVKIFGEAANNEICEPRKDVNEKVGGYTASHELGHAVGLVDGSKERLGATTLVNPYIEEWKATVAGFLANYHLPFLDNDTRSIDDLTNWLVDEIMTACRYAAARNHPYAAAYFRHSMMLMSVAEDVKILVHSGEEEEFPWKINLEPEKVIEYGNRLLAQFKTVMHLYGEGTEDELRSFLEEELVSTPFMEFVCQGIEVPDADQYTPHLLAQLPEKSSPSISDISSEVAEDVDLAMK